MAPFFHLTHLGYQQPIKSFVLAPPLPPAPEKFTLPEIKGYGKGPQASYDKHRTLMTKHTRKPSDAHELFRVPVVTSSDLGWWKRESPVTLEWTSLRRRVKVHSEMTRFVEQMAMTNREFSLF